MRGTISQPQMLRISLVSMLETLEKEGFVETSLDKDGDKELIPISELIANAVKESEKTT
jgi:DNA-binding PadR family transcriptional regulator